MLEHWNMPIEKNEGWTCPVCKRGVTPLLTVCPCEEAQNLDYEPFPPRSTFKIKVRYKHLGKMPPLPYPDDDGWCY